MVLVRSGAERRRHLDIATAVTVFLARSVYGDADLVAEKKLSASPHDVNSVVSKLVAPHAKTGGRSRASVRDAPLSYIVHALLRTGVIRLGESGFTVSGRSIKEVATAVLGAEVAENLEKYLLSTIASDIALLKTVLVNSTVIPTWFADYVSESSPVDVAVHVAMLNMDVWKRLPPEARGKLVKRLTGHGALLVLKGAPWVVDSSGVLFELLSKVVGEELPETATELIARYAPELVGEASPELEEVGSAKLISKPPALVRVDLLYSLDPESVKGFTVFDTRTRLGIAVDARTVGEAVRSAYSSLLDSYFEFREVASELGRYSAAYGCTLVTSDEVVGGFRLPLIRVYDADGYVFAIPLQVNFRKAFESALEDVHNDSAKRRDEATASTSRA